MLDKQSDTTGRTLWDFLDSLFVHYSWFLFLLISVVTAGLLLLSHINTKPGEVVEIFSYPIYRKSLEEISSPRTLEEAPNHIFISYSHEDGDFAEILRRKLEKAHFKVWTDDNRLIPGENWREGIDQAIRDALALIVVMTPTAKASEYVTYEWAFAWGIGVKVIPILLKPTPLHPRLEVLQYLDFTDRTMRPWNKLINSISKFPRGVSHVIQNAIAMLDSPIKSDRESAVDTLLESNHPAAFEALIQTLYHHTLDSMRKTAAKALGQIKDVVVVPTLIKALHDQPSDVRQTVAEVLEQIGDTAVPTLIKALHNQHSDVRQAAAGTLGQIGDTAAVPALIKILDDQQSDIRVRQAAAEALGQIGDSAAVPVLIKILDDQQLDIRIRRATAEALGQIGDLAAVPVLIKTLKALDDQDSYMRWVFTEPLRKIGNAVAESYGQIGDTAAVPALIKALDDQDSDARRIAAEVLGQIRDTAAVPMLIKILNDQDFDVRMKATEALGQIGDAAAVPALIKALDDQDLDARMITADALGQIGDAAAVPALIKVLDDQDSDVYQAAAEALERIGTPQALEALKNPKP